MINDWRVPVLSSAIDFLFELEPRPTLRGVRVQCFQTAKGYSNASSVRGKKRAIGWILQLLLGRTASAPHGEHEAPCGHYFGYAAKCTQSVYVRAKMFLTDLGTLELSWRAKTCGCGFAFPYEFGSLTSAPPPGKQPLRKYLP